MRNTAKFLASLMFVIAACTPAGPSNSVPLTVPPSIRASSTSTATSSPSPTGTLTHAVELQPSETPSLTPTPTLACERETASVVLSASAESLKVGDATKVTVTVSNEGCVALGLPQYRLYMQSDNAQSIFAPASPEPVVHSLAVAPGQSDSTVFELTAVASGQATLTATVSYEVHLGYPGPAYWGMTGSNQPLILIVAP